MNHEESNTRNIQLPRARFVETGDASAGEACATEKEKTRDEMKCSMLKNIFLLLLALLAQVCISPAYSQDAAQSESVLSATQKLLRAQEQTMRACSALFKNYEKASGKQAIKTGLLGGLGGVVLGFVGGIVGIYYIGK